ncbi:MAG TPA: PEP-CTERM sorting domain-containing protein [Verrucomicrobiota bacterium]|nr:MAG: hypothetical protein BWX68_01093 [Verrucomicrobia bacterium ADurb.Bin063]HNW08025.1 PEP-CTERM sorting domain-containing protein [Verrucomicrobiota bacterium]HNZ76204.1 PEP-CTERM sorting domain-containing protein [Verrucomicrobiota bacterium]HOH39224.1 PEP-CTERM sorting domain-containing protein [Verrucomicrobiota bacterium]HOY56841.1 PEP-CTERM sorting domain-containing protein [Verrucomicrobiota bacterium]
MSRLARIIAPGLLLLSWIQPSMAQGTIQFFEPTAPILLHTEFFAEYYPLDLNGDGTTDFTFAYDFHFIGVRPEGDGRILTWLDPPPNIGGSVAPVPAGFVIGAGSGAGSLQWLGRLPGVPYDSDFNTLIQCFDAGCSGAFAGQYAYMGVEFQSAGATHYGWVSLSIASDAPFGAINAWAWETLAGLSIAAGAIPEPSASALLTVGGTLFWLLRRRKSNPLQ